MQTVHLEQCPGNAQSERAGLAGDPAAVAMGSHVERAQRVRCGKGLLDVLNQRGPREVITQRPAVDFPLPGAGGEVDAGNAGLAAANTMPTQQFGSRGHADTLIG